MSSSGTYWDPEFDDLDPDDFLYDKVKKFRENNPPPKGGIDTDSQNPEADPGVSYDGQPLDYYLYYGVRDLTDDQKVDRMENAYYDRLMDIAAQTTRERAEDYIRRVEDGQNIPDEVMSKIHDESLSPQMEAKARRAAEQNFLHALRLGVLDSYHTNYVGAVAGKEPLPILYEPVKRWKLNPNVERVLSEKRGYDGNFYSWFFGQNGPRKSHELDDAFFRTVRDGLETGKTEKEIIDEAEQVCVADNINRARLKNIVRTETRRAFNEGRVLENDRLAREAVAAGREPFVIAYKFTGILDGREWEGCHARDGLLIAWDDPRLKDHTPPLHYYCRSKLTPLTRVSLPKYGGEKQLKADKPKWDKVPKFQWRHTPNKELFAEGDIMD